MPDHPTETIAAIEALLDKAAAAHHVYERDALRGVYDEQWPAWYGAYVVERGLGRLVGRDLAAGDVGDTLMRGWEAFSSLDPKPTVSWSAWMARRIAAEA
jgi:hypothetical protein